MVRTLLSAVGRVSYDAGCSNDIASDHQDCGRIKHNSHRGTFNLTGILPAPAGIPQIEVKFDIDANGILKVTAKDKNTGRSNDIVIKNQAGRLSEDEITRMINDAEVHKAEDEALLEKVTAKNSLENYAYSIRNALNEEYIKNLVQESDRKAVEDAVQATIFWLESNQHAEKEEYKEQDNKLKAVYEPVMAKLQQAAGGAGGSGGSPRGGGASATALGNSSVEDLD
jgi:L1 cell adhesion molecule like protein